MKISNKNRVICHCMNVDYITIEKLKKDGVLTLEEISNITGASTRCGGCCMEIEKIMGLVKKDDI